MIQIHKLPLVKANLMEFMICNYEGTEKFRKLNKKGWIEMNEAYYEIMVEKKNSPGLKIAQIVMIILAVFFTLMMLIGVIWGLPLAVACGVAYYFISLRVNVEYEYLYVDKELQIDRILAKSKRKRMETLDLKQLEILAPARSHELDSYRNGKYAKADYTSGDETKERYILVVSGKQIMFEPSEEMVKTIKMFAPRKVFTY